jgi:N-acetylmuramoyl-L-alanine amidase
MSLQIPSAKRCLLKQAQIIPVFLLIMAGITSGAAFANSIGKDTPIAFAARVVGDDTRSRLIIDFDRKIEHHIYLLDHPKRIIVELPETVFNLDVSQKMQSKSLVSGLRFGVVKSGHSRIVMELARSATIESHRLKEIVAEKRHRLFVDVTTTTDELFAAQVRKAVEQEEVPVKSIKFVSPNSFTIVLDPGHGGIDGGASGDNHGIEKDITLEFAVKLKERLSQYPAYNLILTRHDDRFLGLADRIKIARGAKADLFLSIHADSLSQKSIRGATVYTLSKEGSDDISRYLAKKQNRTDLIAGLDLPPTKPNVFDILIDMTRRESKAFSAQFADLLVKRMSADVKLIRNPHRSADFYVLKSPEVPSVLLELGYLSNQQDETLMRSPEWQTRAADHVVEAIKEFFDTRLAQK